MNAISCTTYEFSRAFFFEKRQCFFLPWSYVKAYHFTGNKVTSNYIYRQKQRGMTDRCECVLFVLVPDDPLMNLVDCMNVKLDYCVPRNKKISQLKKMKPYTCYFQVDEKKSTFPG